MEEVWFIFVGSVGKTKHKKNNPLYGFVHGASCQQV